MIAILSLLVILTVSLIVTRIATVALIHTGLSRQSAQFQARSALTGVGFTTHESENIVNHPVRRRVAMILMLFGNAGIVSAIASLLLTFLNTDPTSFPLPYRLLILVLGLAVLWMAAQSKLVDKWLSRWITWAFTRWSDLEVRDYASLLHLADNHQILEMTVNEQDWIADRTLAELALSDEGIIVIGIQRSDGSYVGAPAGRTRIDQEDLLLLYGRDSALKELDQRCCGATGDEAHAQAVAEHRRIVAEQEGRK